MKAPHEIRRPNKRYTGTSDNVMAKLRRDGYDVSWYAKRRAVRDWMLDERGVMRGRTHQAGSWAPSRLKLPPALQWPR
jgi:hypothetical protein